MGIFDDENKKKIAIDESLFAHIDKKKIWIIGLINSQTKEFRLMPSFKRDSGMIKRIVQKFIKWGNTIISDALDGYVWISLPNSGYNYIRHVNGNEQFWYGDESTSHI